MDADGKVALIKFDCLLLGKSMDNFEKLNYGIVLLQKLAQSFQKTLNKHVNNISTKIILKNGCLKKLVM